MVFISYPQEKLRPSGGSFVQAVPGFPDVWGLAQTPYHRSRPQGCRLLAGTAIPKLSVISPDPASSLAQVYTYPCKMATPKELGQPPWRPGFGETSTVSAARAPLDIFQAKLNINISCLY